VQVSGDEWKWCLFGNQSGGGRNEDNLGGLRKGLGRRGPLRSECSSDGQARLAENK
jgi:hypothetical protein